MEEKRDLELLHGHGVQDSLERGGREGAHLVAHAPLRQGLLGEQEALRQRLELRVREAPEVGQAGQHVALSRQKKQKKEKEKKVRLSSVVVGFSVVVGKWSRNFFPKII